MRTELEPEETVRTLTPRSGGCGGANRDTTDEAGAGPWARA
jgi:hypothetical protein